MTYEKFKQEQDLKNERERQKALCRANQEYNRGLVKGLGLWNAHLYPALKRAET
jgi:hypothetical protein